MAVVAAFGYLLYRVTLTAVESHLPEVLDRLDDANEQRDSPPRSAPTSPPDSGEEDSDRD